MSGRRRLPEEDISIGIMKRVSLVIIIIFFILLAVGLTILDHICQVGGW